MQSAPAWVLPFCALAVTQLMRRSPRCSRRSSASRCSPASALAATCSLWRPGRPRHCSTSSSRHPEEGAMRLAVARCCPFASRSATRCRPSTSVQRRSERSVCRLACVRRHAGSDEFHSGSSSRRRRRWPVTALSSTRSRPTSSRSSRRRSTPPRRRQRSSLRAGGCCAPGTVCASLSSQTRSSGWEPRARDRSMRATSAPRSSTGSQSGAGW